MAKRGLNEEVPLFNQLPQVQQVVGQPRCQHIAGPQLSAAGT
jgi:hypothetical protein